MATEKTFKIGDKEIKIETGKIAKQAGGSCILTCGETVVLVTVCGSPDARPGADFFPLTVDYIEKTYAAGKIPGGFFKREGKLRDHEVLTSRLIDRPCRPLFPEGYRNEVQVIATVLSVDKENPSDVLALTGASAALHTSPLPWNGPIAGVRVGRVEGKWIANPTFQELENSDCDLIIAASRDAIVMVEGGTQEMSEEDLLEALFFGHESIQETLDVIEELKKGVGKEKWPVKVEQRDSAIDEKVKALAEAGIQEACNIHEKHARYGKFKEVKAQVVEKLAPEFPEQEGDIKSAYEDLRYNSMRGQVLNEQRRVDGRDFKTVRPIDIELGLLPRVHGSSLFTRGETQAIVTATLGTSQDEQKIDALTGEFWKRFILHYNFPPYSVGETKPMRGPGRREVGHGHLAERALSSVIPSNEDFPYTLRIVSEITESNGSSSMATVCGGSLALMDSGVPIKAPVAGVAMGLIMEGEKYAVLTDILGDEDHLGDMDFKVCGTEKGVTAIQMDIKIEGLSRKILEEALAQAKEGRLHILSKMKEVIDAPREELSTHAPRIQTVQVKPDQVRNVIGQGGKNIRSIIETTGATVDVEDDGTVTIASNDAEAMRKAIEMVELFTAEPELGKTYKGVVRRVEPYGAFLEVLPGHDGLLHISDFAWERTEEVTDVMDLGDEVEVVISNIDPSGKIKLSRKALLPKPDHITDDDEEEDRPRRGRGDGRGRRDGRGGDRRGFRDRERGGRDRGSRPSRNRDDRERSESNRRDRD